MHRRFMDVLNKRTMVRWNSVLTIVLLVFILVACGADVETQVVPETEDVAVLFDNEPSENVVEIEEPDTELGELAFEPVFVDPFGGSKNEGQIETDDGLTETHDNLDGPDAEEAPQQAMNNDTPEHAPIFNSDPATQGQIGTEDEQQPDPQPEPTPQPDPEPQPQPDPELQPEVEVPQQTLPSGGGVVYITDTGKRYHRGTCRHLADSKIETTLDAAVAMGLTPCGTCY